MNDFITVQEMNLSQFCKMASEWDGLAAKQKLSEPFICHRFLRTWIDNFAPDACLRLFAAYCRDGLIAALPLIEDRTFIRAVPLRRLRSPTNVHSNRFDMLLEPGRLDAARAIWNRIRDLDTYDVIELCDVPENGNARVLFQLAQEDGYPAEAWESMRTPYIEINASAQGSYLSEVDARFSANLRRRRRILGQRGKVEMQRFDGGFALEKYLEEGIALEKAGWKGRASTAIASDVRNLGFYMELARGESRSNRLVLYFLRLEGTPVAFQFGLQSGDTYFLPKTAYDESQSDCSPGQLLMENVLEDCKARGIETFDFLGPAMNWKMDWTSRYLAHHWLYVFGKSKKAAVARQLKFGIGQKLSRRISRWRQ